MDKPPPPPWWLVEDEGQQEELVAGHPDGEYESTSEYAAATGDAAPQTTAGSERGEGTTGEAVVAATTRHERQDYPTTEQAVRTLALHTGLGYLLGLGVGLAAKAQSIFRAGRLFGSLENARTHVYVDPFAFAADFARPLFLVACIEVGSMYTKPALHNMRLPRRSLSTNSARPSGETKESDHEAWGEEQYEYSAQNESENDDGRYATVERDELARGTGRRKEAFSESIQHSDDDALDE